MPILTKGVSKALRAKENGNLPEYVREHVPVFLKFCNSIAVRNLFQVSIPEFMISAIYMDYAAIKAAIVFEVVQQ